MRDQYDAQIWADHHDQFSQWFTGVLGRAGDMLRHRLAEPPAVTGQLLAASAALSLTLLTFTASAA